MKSLKLDLLIATIFLLSSVGFAQKKSITKEDVFVYSPTIVIDKLPDKVEESSGLLFFKNDIWTLNDSGGEPEIYRINSKSGKIIQVVRIRNAKNIDFEDLTQDNDYIYVGDFGNNFGNRKDLSVYKIAKKDIPENENGLVDAERIQFEYADQKKFEKKSRKNDFDCEAIISRGDSLYLFTKNWVDARTRVYALPKSEGNYRIRVIDEFAVDGLITAAAFNSKDDMLCLLGYKNFMPFIWVFPNTNQHDLFGGKKLRLDLENIHGAQTEGLCFDANGDLLISCEQSYYPQRLFIIPGQDLKINNHQPENKKHTDTLVLNVTYEENKELIHIQIRGLEKGSYSLEVLNEMWKREEMLTNKSESRKVEKIDLSAKKLKTGLYYIRIEQNNTPQVSRVYINK